MLRNFLLLTGCYLWVSIFSLQAQENLIPNPGFENYKKLPNEDGCFLDYVESWHNLNGKKSYPNATPDYLHRRGSNNGKVSTAYFAAVEPQEGEAMTGVIVIPNRPFYEYVCAPLIRPLERGKRYELSFYVNNGAPKYCKCSGRGFGVYFSEGMPKQQQAEQIEAEPQFVVEDNLYTKEWQKVGIQFTADKAYTHLTVGYFAKPKDLNMKDITGGLSDCIYFFVDNFELKLIPTQGRSDLVVQNLPTGITNFSSKFGKVSIEETSTKPTPKEPTEYTMLVRVQVKDKKTNKNLSAQISLIDLVTKQEIAQATLTESQNTYTFALPKPQQRYGIFAKAKGYVEASENTEPQTLKQDLTIEKTIFLSPLQKGETIVLKNIYFETAKADLRPEAFVELQKLLNLMKDNPKLTVEIAGHTDSEGEDYKNMDLSRRRAEAVVQYLKANQIEANRLKSIGYGETKPIAPNETPEGRQQNRRVEFKIIDF